MAKHPVKRKDPCTPKECRDDCLSPTFMESRIVCFYAFCFLEFPVTDFLAFGREGAAADRAESGCFVGSADDAGMFKAAALADRLFIALEEGSSAFSFFDPTCSGAIDLALMALFNSISKSARTFI